ncbi:MAG: outer membrane beta-barrel protein [Sphingomonadales bacterium]
MKTNLLLVLLLVTGFSLSAQTRFGLKTGIASGSVTSNDDLINAEGTALGSFQLGGIFDTRLTSKLSLQSQLLFLGKGVAIGVNTGKNKYRFAALDIPLQLLYRTKGGWFIGGGPNLGFNLSAKNVYLGQTKEITLGNEAGQVKAFDFGVTATGGYQSKTGLVLSINYVKGLTNLSNEANAEWRNNVLGFTLGYMLPLRAKK